MKNIKIIALIFITSFLLNFAWEFLQSPLYDCFNDSLADNYSHYLLAIIWDSIYTILIYGIIAIINKDLGWIQNSLNRKNIAITVILWIILAIFIEYKWVYILWKWNYSNLMPMILGIGIMPLLQMMILPVLSFKIVRRLNSWY